MKFTRLLTLITEVLNKDSDTKVDVSLTSQMARDIELWSRMYEKRPPWLKKDRIYTMELPAAVAGPAARGQSKRAGKWAAHAPKGKVKNSRKTAWRRHFRAPANTVQGKLRAN